MLVDATATGAWTSAWAGAWCLIRCNTRERLGISANSWQSPPELGTSPSLNRHQTLTSGAYLLQHTLGTRQIWKQKWTKMESVDKFDSVHWQQNGTETPLAADAARHGAILLHSSAITTKWDKNPAPWFVENVNFWNLLFARRHNKCKSRPFCSHYCLCAAPRRGEKLQFIWAC